MKIWLGLFVATVGLGMGSVVWAQGSAPAVVGPPRVPANGTQVAPLKIDAGDDKGGKGEVPLDTASEQPATDVAATASPVAPEFRGLYLRPGVPLAVRLLQPASSAVEVNGQAVSGVLLGAVTASDGRVLAVGTPVRMSVVSAAAAGKMRSAGLLSVQVDRVGGVAVITNVLDFDGQEGKKDLPDSAPAKGTEALVGTDAVLQFNVQGAGNGPDPTDRVGQGGGGRGGAVRGGGAPGQTGAPGMQTPAPGATTPH